MLAAPRKFASASLLVLASLLAACGSDNNPVDPGAQHPTGVAVTSTSATTARIAFTGHSGDASYVVERSGGGSATFASVGTVAASTTTSSYTFDDTGLTPATQYQYRVSAVRGGTTSTPSNSVTTTTTAPGAFAADITTDITTSRTLYPDTTYTLKGYIHVANGATLTIQPGTTIKGDFNTLGSSLFILRGAKINAVGTASLPIVFTSSRAAGQRQPGDWGGLIIVGNAIDNRSGSVEVEGTNTVTGTAPGTNYQVIYSGGTNSADNSGELKYVRVEFAGFAPSLNNELNSFTFAAVGSGTKLSYLESLAGLDDSYEWFGGAVDGDHLVSYEAGDDHFDQSESFSGRLQYLIAFQSTVLTQRTGAGSPSVDPEGIENDGCNGSGCDLGFNSAPFTIPVISNFTLVGTGDLASAGTSGGIGMMIRRGSGGYYVNGIVARWPRAGVSIRDAETYTRAGATATPDLATADLALKNILFVQTPTIFQAASGSTVQNSFDLASNGLVNNTTATTASLFTAFPTTVDGSTTEAAFDWTPSASSAAASGGLATFTGKLATKTATALPTGVTITGTSYVGAAAPGGPKWWAGWTRYSQK